MDARADIGPRGVLELADDTRSKLGIKKERGDERRYPCVAGLQAGEDDHQDGVTGEQTLLLEEARLSVHVSLCPPCALVTSIKLDYDTSLGGLGAFVEEPLWRGR